jgi:hypothetical protein
LQGAAARAKRKIVRSGDNAVFEDKKGDIDTPQSAVLAGAFFCTADAAAIRALALLGHSGSGISLETLLSKTGLQKAFGPTFYRTLFQEAPRQRNARPDHQNRVEKMIHPIILDIRGRYI